MASVAERQTIKVVFPASFRSILVQDTPLLTSLMYKTCKTNKRIRKYSLSNPHNNVKFSKTWKISQL